MKKYTSEDLRKLKKLAWDKSLISSIDTGSIDRFIGLLEMRENKILKRDLSPKPERKEGEI